MDEKDYKPILEYNSDEYFNNEDCEYDLSINPASTDIEDRIYFSKYSSGIIQALTTTLALPFSLFLVKYLELEGVNPFEIIMVRSVILILYDCGYIFLNNLTSDFFNTYRNNFYDMNLRGALGALNMMIIWVVATLAPMGEQASVRAISCVWTPIFAYYYIGEYISYEYYIYIPLNIIGVIMIYRPPIIFDYSQNNFSDSKIVTMYPLRNIGLLVSILCSILLSTCIVLMRKMKSVKSEYSTLIWGIASILISSVGIFWTHPFRFEFKHTFSVIVISLLSLYNQQCNAKSLRIIETHVFQGIKQLAIVVYFVGDAIIWQSTVYNSSLFGAGIIIIISIVIILRERGKQTNK